MPHPLSSRLPPGPARAAPNSPPRRALVLKGPLLSKRYYGDFGTRDAGDVDILVDEARAAEADQVSH